MRRCGGGGDRIPPRSVSMVWLGCEAASLVKIPRLCGGNWDSATGSNAPKAVNDEVGWSWRVRASRGAASCRTCGDFMVGSTTFTQKFHARKTDRKEGVPRFSTNATITAMDTESQGGTAVESKINDLREHILIYAPWERTRNHTGRQPTTARTGTCPYFAQRTMFLWVYLTCGILLKVFLGYLPKCHIYCDC